jgi:DNA-binding MarR family transcriptional regulator
MLPHGPSEVHPGKAVTKGLSHEQLVRYHHYVARSTHDGVERNSEDASLGHYSDPPLLVLASLADGPKHGHAMIDDIARMCGTRLGPGTLYGAITRLEQQGLIQPLAPEERRQPYRITAKGLRLLRAKLTTLQRFARAGVRKLEAQ